MSRWFQRQCCVLCLFGQTRYFYFVVEVCIIGKIVELVYGFSSDKLDLIADSKWLC